MASHPGAVKLLAALLDSKAASFEQMHSLAAAFETRSEQNTGVASANDANIRLERGGQRRHFQVDMHGTLLQHITGSYRNLCLRPLLEIRVSPLPCSASGVPECWAAAAAANLFAP